LANLARVAPFVIALTSAALLWAAPSGGQTRHGGDLWVPGGPRPWERMEPTAPWRDQRIRRHRKFMLDGVPGEYRGRANPLKPTASNIRAGRTLYADRCAGCHGARGRGDGDEGKGLSPSPALLAALVERPVSVDEYLLWTIAEGGAGLGSDMPAFKNDMSETEIWLVVLFMRAGFPASNRR
jgi:mono/diheme cytochrome c family protein